MSRAFPQNWDGILNQKLQIVKIGCKEKICFIPTVVVSHAHCLLYLPFFQKDAQAFALLPWSCIAQRVVISLGIYPLLGLARCIARWFVAKGDCASKRSISRTTVVTISSKRFSDGSYFSHTRLSSADTVPFTRRKQAPFSRM